ncbi:low molecular weight protein-tyrosine-phosphatase [Magnetospirillum molischianum]|uniref:protein-tyrosine-phosphatase n=1 Tax=Magnetospirillum molischianum DSM 120 TaxID=1150626 RepID=H8FV56_MAGML|nr:low molecular weight protein-tyrosine-phosphatase [Magnetospirillum molischianum]CCG42244.1 putative Protein-tyrosine-phosphatase [Magnetospirillum molischianum DSM 120]
MVKVLFVCTGNICRSPSAEGVFRDLVERRGLSGDIQTDSAGTHAYHVGARPDERSVAAAARRGIDLEPLRARVVCAEDFDRFDLILAMDRGHLDLLRQCCPPDRHNRLRLFLSFAPGLGVHDVPDPYYGGTHDFERVLDLIETGAAGLLDHLVPDTV